MSPPRVYSCGGVLTMGRWEPLEEKPEPGQWEYFGKTSTAS
jgi:NADH dehydrogenase (ubiquinone) 1 alpha subcomplex subunit 5